MIKLEIFVGLCYNSNMLLDLSRFNLENKVVAVALSGGSDSVALLHYMKSQADMYRYTLKAINVEHGIRGENSIKDSLFVKNLCEKLSIPLKTFSVDAPTFSKENKYSLEEGARILRYNCFLRAISEGFCDLVATAHHESDNFESLLFNLFRGSGLSGVSGINEIQNNGIIRPLLKTSKEEILNYVKENCLEFVTDNSNLDDKYTRNYLRLNIIPEIKKIFASSEKSASRFCEIATLENDFLQKEAEKTLNFCENKVEISIPCHKAIFNRAVILALKYLGVKKDWEKVHLDACYSLLDKENGKSINLLDGVVAIKEYDKIVLYKPQNFNKKETTFSINKISFLDKTILVEKVCSPIELKDGFYADLDKIPASAVIRTKKESDTFTKFGGGTKSLGDYLTDKKIPLRERNSLPLLCYGKEVLAIFGVAISDKIKVDEKTNTIIKLTIY